MNNSVFKDKCNIINLFCRGLLSIIKTTRAKWYIFITVKKKLTISLRFGCKKIICNQNIYFLGLFSATETVR